MKKLSRDELKNVMGGNEPIGGGDPEGSCCAHGYDGMNSWEVWCCGLSKSEAQTKASQLASNGGFSNAYWCCSSCTQTSDSHCSV